MICASDIMECCNSTPYSLVGHACPASGYFRGDSMESNSSRTTIFAHSLGPLTPSQSLWPTSPVSAAHLQLPKGGHDLLLFRQIIRFRSRSLRHSAGLTHSRMTNYNACIRYSPLRWPRTIECSTHARPDHDMQIALFCNVL